MDFMSILQTGAEQAAPLLLGWQWFCREADGSLTGGIINETEAYTQADAASHSYKGMTSRTATMFGPAGNIYVYFTYGLHWCANFVTGATGQGEAVLIRSLWPTHGLDTMQLRRHSKLSVLCNGPAKLCQALAITGADNGISLTSERFVLLPPLKDYGAPRVSRRIGITKDTHRLWRFTIDITA